MPVFKDRSVLSGMKVKEAMQRQVIQLTDKTCILQCVRVIIKFKANAVLVIHSDGNPVGVVSKTDILGAYYAGISLQSPISDIMVSPPNFCHSKDSLERAVQQMNHSNIHQIYVRAETDDTMEGQMAYSDIVGLLYRYCRACTRSARHSEDRSKNQMRKLLVKDVMTRDVASCNWTQSIAQVIEILSSQRIGAILVTENDQARGIISKTDLVLSYIRGIGIDTHAQVVMKEPVVSCRSDVLLSSAIQKMFLFDIQRVFVTQKENTNVTGVLSLSDATRFRSGTCSACGTGRVL